MPTGIAGRDFLFLIIREFFSHYFSRLFGKGKHLPVVMLMLIIPFYGCAAGQVMVASYENETANCSRLDKELGVARTRLQKLESKDSTARNIRDFVLGVGGFFVPPIAVVNAVLFFADSYAADYTEKQALKSHYNKMVMTGQGQGCGSSYALIPVEEEGNEPNA
jgi:hypothetical protein